MPQTGSYEVTAALTRAADYGIVQVAIDGVPVGAPFDGYQPAGVGVADHPLGTHNLSAGQHTLTLTVTSRNPAAIGWLAGLDVLDVPARLKGAARRRPGGRRRARLGSRVTRLGVCGQPSRSAGSRAGRPDR